MSCCSGRVGRILFEILLNLIVVGEAMWVGVLCKIWLPDCRHWRHFGVLEMWGTVRLERSDVGYGRHSPKVVVDRRQLRTDPLTKSLLQFLVNSKYAQGLLLLHRYFPSSTKLLTVHVHEPADRFVDVRTATPAGSNPSTFFLTAPDHLKNLFSTHDLRIATIQKMTSHDHEPL